MNEATTLTTTTNVVTEQDKGRCAQAPRSAPLRQWIAECRCRVVKTIVVWAPSRKEAQAALDNGEGEGLDEHYYDAGPVRVLRQAKPNDKLRHGEENL
jgi:hypothetical protein